jgi:hypothetical protein
MNLLSIFQYIIKVLASINNGGNTNGGEEQINTGGDMSKVAICVGINDYPGTGNDLQGCLNDAKDWGSLLSSKFNFGKVTYLLDKAATWANVTNALKSAIAEAKSGDSIAFTYSGHGTSVADKNNDEPNGKDEAMCLYDKFLIDDDIRPILDGVKDGVKLTIVSDSCFSGTVTRALLETIGGCEYKKARYMPPKETDEAILTARLPVKSKLFSAENMKEVLISGCNDKQYSYDAIINGRANGAMTYYAMQAVNVNPNASYEEFFAELRKRLPSEEYPQSPQLEGSTKNLKANIFA